ncbi:MAG: redoxin domain-containing protein [Bacteroidales bacterium]|nr:redoxin domain-containing protein [Bacteroidales bacterium]
MKQTTLVIALILLITIACNREKKVHNVFNSDYDTLFITTKKIKGYGLFNAASYNLDFVDTIEEKSFRLVYPNNVSDIKVAYELIDFKPTWFGNIKMNKSDYMPTFLKNYYPNKFDTLNIPTLKENSICILSGKKAGEDVFIVDENNNKDFTDDKIRSYRKFDNKSLSDLIPCKYNIYNGTQMAEDSGWINIGVDNSNILVYSVAHHLECDFTYDNHSFKIGIINSFPFLRFCFENPLIAILSKDELKKDSLNNSDIATTGEYLRLSKSYYYLADISNDGRLVTLVKEKDVSNKIGTQVGFIAPDFNCHSIDGDSIALNDYRGKYLLLINVSACWSEISSYKCFMDLTETFKNKFEFIGIDDSPIALRNNIKDLEISGRFVIAADNPMIRNTYRPDICSRTCFLIGPDGRIIDNFEIFDWETILKNHFH